MTQTSPETASVDIVERLLSNETLPACPFDRIPTLYLTIPDDKPCPFCGQENTLDGPDKCRGAADTRLFKEAADEIVRLRGLAQTPREKVIEECASYLEQKADLLTNSLHCGDNSATIAAAHKKSRQLYEAAAIINELALRTAPSDTSTDRGGDNG